MMDEDENACPRCETGHLRDADEPGPALRCSDCGRGFDSDLTEHKERRRSGWFGRVDPRGTSQDCSRCGAETERRR